MTLSLYAGTVLWNPSDYTKKGFWNVLHDVVSSTDIQMSHQNSRSPREVWATTVHELRVAYQNQLAKAEDSD